MGNWLVKRPNYIPIPPPVFGTLSLSSSPSPRDNPFESAAPPSPCLLFYTAPSSPLSERTPSPPPNPPLPPEDDPFPSADLTLDLPLDDDALSTLEKIYLYSQSRATFHRVYISHALPQFLNQVDPAEAVEYVLPLLSGLAMDPGSSCARAYCLFVTESGKRGIRERGARSRTRAHNLVVLFSARFLPFKL
jgi:serine/threonine-protein phosphatase 4 regulatory subunit 1